MMTRGKSLDKVQLAYTAGMFDGEGCVTAYIRHDDGREPYVVKKACITSTSLKEIKLFKSWFGGRIDKKITGHPVWKDAYNWVCTGEDMRNFLTLIMPYLRIKRKRSELMIELMNLDARGMITKEKRASIKRRQMEIFMIIRSMNQKYGSGHPQRLSERTQAAMLGKR